MIKKKVKKIPKYNTGAVTISPDVLNNAMAGKFNTPTQFGEQQPMASIAQHSQATVGLSRVDSAATNASAIAGAIGAAGSGLGAALGIRQGKAGQIANTLGDMASVIPGIGPIIGAGLKNVGGFLGDTGSVDVNTGEIEYGSGIIGGLFGPSRKELRRKSNQIKNSIQAKSQTENLVADYYNDPNVVQNPNVLAAEGGIMRRPVDALVSKGELIYNPMTKKLSKVPGSKGKPNKADDVYARLYEGDVVISNSPTMLMANGKTPAQNLEGLVDSNKNVKAKEAIIKKVVNWQEANKTKPQEYAMYSEGDIVENAKKRDRTVAATIVDGKSYIKLGDGHWYTDINGQAGKRVILTPKLRKAFADVKETPSGYDNDIKLTPGGYDQKWEWQSEHANNPMYQQLFGQNKKYNLAQPLRQVELAGYNYGPSYGEYDPDFGNYDYSSWLRIPDNWRSENATTTGSRSTKATAAPQQTTVKNNGPTPVKEAKTSLAAERPKDVPKLNKMSQEEIKAHGDRWASLLKDKPNTQWLDKLAGIAPVAAALINKPDYHKEEAIISPAKYIPTGVNIDPIRRAADESFAMARYNQANINPNTGAGMAYGLQAAANRTKALADAYKWQQDTQNRLITQNVGIYNDWSKRYDAARYKAIENTMANEAAADAQYDTRIKDAMSYYRDWQLTPFLKQYLSSGAYKENVNRLS